MPFGTQATTSQTVPPGSSGAHAPVPLITSLRRPFGLFLDHAFERLRRVNDARALQALEPRLARDIGADPSGNPAPEGFAVDPRPLWGVGLTPQPVSEHPPWR